MFRTIGVPKDLQCTNWRYPGGEGSFPAPSESWEGAWGLGWDGWAGSQKWKCNTSPPLLRHWTCAATAKLITCHKANGLFRKKSGTGVVVPSGRTCAPWWKWRDTIEVGGIPGGCRVRSCCTSSGSRRSSDGNYERGCFCNCHEYTAAERGNEAVRDRRALFRKTWLHTLPSLPGSTVRIPTEVLWSPVLFSARTERHSEGGRLLPFKNLSADKPHSNFSLIPASNG